MSHHVDLNADVGEGFAADSALFRLVTSANVACGFHAGDAQSMRAACAAAVDAEVAIGAHVSYRDRDGFGRRELNVDAGTVAADALAQIEALREAADAVGGGVTYVKPHGALYHRASVDQECAEALVSAAEGLAVLGFPGSLLIARARHAGLPAYEEGFADRAYAADGTLVPRGDPAASLGAAAAAQQAVALAQRGAVRSICIHSDTAGAAGIAVAVRDALLAAGFELQPFA